MTNACVMETIDYNYLTRKNKINANKLIEKN